MLSRCIEGRCIGTHHTADHATRQDITAGVLARKECCLGPRFQDPCGCASFQICGSLLGPMDLASDSLFGIDGSGLDVSLHSWEACPDITLFWCYCPVPVCGRFLRSWSRKWHHFECQNPDPEAGPENGTTLGARIRTLFWARVLVSLGQNHYIGKKTISIMHTRAQNGFWHPEWCHFLDQLLGPDSGTQNGAAFRTTF